MEIIKNNKGGSKLCAQGYLYTKKSSNRTRIHWECSQKHSLSCRGSAVTDLDMQQLISASQHTHERDYNKVRAAKVRNIIKTVALSNTFSTSNIITETIGQQPPEVRSAVGKIDSLKRHVRRLQNKAMREKADEILNRQGILGPFHDQSFPISPQVLSMKCEEDDTKVEPGSSDEKNHLFLIDTDPGLDDAQAILMALAVDHVNVLALTTVQGNSPSYCTCQNALRLLKAADRLDIPVFPGCERPMFSEPLNAGLYHGSDGFGDVPDKDAPGLDMAQSEHAVNSLIRLTREHPGEITLIALGPLTNIAMAIRLEPNLGTKLKNCYIMGGNYRGIGNITRSAEFNFANDPEAAQIVLTELKCPITLCTWELCTDMQQPLALWEKLMSMPGRKAAFMNHIQSVVKSRLEISGCYIMCDELAMAAAIDERTILESQDVFAEVETHGKIARGQLISDWRNLTAKPENVRIVTKMDMDRVEELLVNSFNS